MDDSYPPKSAALYRAPGSVCQVVVEEIYVNCHNRERERARCMCIYVYIYTHVHTHRITWAQSK